MKSHTTIITFLALIHGVLTSTSVTKLDVARYRSYSDLEQERSTLSHPEDLVVASSAKESHSYVSRLWKRRGGGGGGGGGGRGSGGGSTSSGGSSSSGGSRGGSSGSSGSSSSSRGYGGGAYYGGGSTVAYSAGTRSPGANITPFLLGGASLGLLAAAWPRGAWLYPWNTPYRYHNNTANQNQTIPVKCLCDPDDPCGCDDNGNSTFLDSLILPNGTSSDQSVARIATVNDTQTLFLNGTLLPGTDDDTSSGSMTIAHGALYARKPVIDGMAMAAVVIGLIAL